ncbi:MAG: hypothetical protein WCV91_02725 [Candidatus Margulisiibacteriota bacterium]
MAIDSIRLYPSGIGAPHSTRFRLTWTGQLDRWRCVANQPGFPIRVSCAAIEEALTRENGQAFLLRSLSRACGQELNITQVDPEITVYKDQEGSDSGIFKVTAKVTTGSGETKPVSFCINAAKASSQNQRHHDIFDNFIQLRKIDPRFVVRPYFYTIGKALHQGSEVGLAVFSVEWLEGYSEVSAVNIAEDFSGLPPDLGMAPAGMRRFFLNDRKFKSMHEAEIRDRKLTEALGEEMIRILFTYFDLETGIGIHNFGINNGDFVYKALPDGSFSLKLISVRRFAPFPKAEIVGKSHFNILGFIDKLLYKKETSVTHNDPADRYYDTLAIYPFTALDICRGIRKALIEKYGPEAYKPVLLKILGTLLLMSKLSLKTIDLTSEEIARNIEVSIEITRFISEEEKFESGIIEV